MRAFFKRHHAGMGRENHEELYPVKDGGAGWLPVASILSLLFLFALTLKILHPKGADHPLRFFWLNRFFDHPEWVIPCFFVASGCLLVSLLFFTIRSLRYVLDHPLLFAVIFSIPFFITGFEKYYGDYSAWIDQIKSRYFMSEPGATYIHYLAYKWLHHSCNLGARTVIALTSRVAGVASLAVIAIISNLLYSDRRQRMLFRLVFYFSGVTLLFFGYIENTPLLLPFELLFLFYLISYLKNDNPGHLLYGALWLSIASIVHGSVCFVLPVLGLTLLLRHGFKWRTLLGRGGMALVVYVLPILLFTGWILLFDRRGIVGPVYGNVLGGSDSAMFVPLTTTGGWARYTLFSRHHFYDMTNVMIAGASIYLPVALLYLICNLCALRRGINPLLYGYAVSRMAFLFLWNCDWGFFSDWDLMIPNALPFLLVAACAISGGAKQRWGEIAALPVIAAAIMTTLIFFCVLNEKPPSLHFIRKIQPVATETSACVGRGLTMRFYRDEAFDKMVRDAGTGAPFHIWGREGPIEEISAPPYGVIWEGNLKVPRKGRYRFPFVVVGNYRFYLNDQLIDETWTGVKKHKRETELRLSPGLYRIRIEYFSTKDYGALQGFWEGPGFDREPFQQKVFCRPVE